MTYDEWYQQNYADSPVSHADYTFGEEVSRWTIRNLLSMLRQTNGSEPMNQPPTSAAMKAAQEIDNRFVAIDTQPSLKRQNDMASIIDKFMGRIKESLAAAYDAGAESVRAAPVSEQGRGVLECETCGLVDAAATVITHANKERHRIVMPSSRATTPPPASDERCAECGHSPRTYDHFLRRCNVVINDDSICGHNCDFSASPSDDDELIKMLRLRKELDPDAPDDIVFPAPVPAGDAPKYDVAANVKWLKANASNYVGQWVAIKDGEFIDSDKSEKALHERVGPTKGTGILVTLAAAEPAPSSGETATGDMAIYLAFESGQREGAEATRTAIVGLLRAKAERYVYADALFTNSLADLIEHTPIEELMKGVNIDG